MPAKNQLQKIITPPAPCAWPKLGTPETKIGDKSVKPQHSIKLLFDPENEKHAKFLARMSELDENLEQLLDDAGEDTDLEDARIWLSFKAQKDKETKKKTGLMEMTFKKVVEGEKNNKKWHYPVTVFNRDGEPITSTEERDKIGSGSIVQVAFTPTPYNGPLGAGISRRFEAVMVRKVVSFESTSAADFGEYEDDGEGNWDSLVATSNSESSGDGDY